MFQHSHRLYLFSKNNCPWYCDGKPDDPYLGEKWKESQEIAKFILTNDNVIDITDGATHYHADYIRPPRWTKAKVRTTKIDKHIFYRLRI